MRYVILSPQEQAELEYLQKHSSDLTERTRCLCLLLSNQRFSMEKVSTMLKINRLTVKRLLDSWESESVEERISKLKRAKGQGAKLKLQPIADKIPELMEQNNRNLNLVLKAIEEEYGIKICKLTLQNFLKGTGLYLEESS